MPYCGDDWKHSPILSYEERVNREIVGNEYAIGIQLENNLNESLSDDEDFRNIIDEEDYSENNTSYDNPIEISLYEHPRCITGGYDNELNVFISTYLHFYMFMSIQAVYEIFLNQYKRITLKEFSDILCYPQDTHGVMQDISFNDIIIEEESNLIACMICLCDEQILQLFIPDKSIFTIEELNIICERFKNFGNSSYYDHTLYKAMVQNFFNY